MVKKHRKPAGHRNPAVFWNWFTANAEAIGKMGVEDDPVYASVQAELAKFCPGLTGDSSELPAGLHQFYISANGETALFDTVRTIVAAAPDLPNWKFTAFVPPVAPVNLVSPSGRLLLHRDIWFALVPKRKRFDTMLAVKGLTPENCAEVQLGVIMLTMGVLGEYLSATKLKGAQFCSLPPDPYDVGLRPFSELPGMFGIYFDESASMSMKTFWALIAESRRQAKGDSQRQLAYLHDSVAALDADDIVVFSDLLDNLIHQAHRADARAPRGP